MKLTPETWSEKLGFEALEATRNLPKGLLTEVCRAESAGNANAVSRVGAAGLFQFMPKTAASRGVNALDPRDCAEGAADYLDEHYDRFWKKHAQKYPEFQRESAALTYALACYNWGQGNVDKAQKKYGAAWLNHAPEETKNYVRKITSRLGGEEGIARFTEEHPTGAQAGIGGNTGDNFFLQIVNAIVGAVSEMFAAIGITNNVETPSTPRIAARDGVGAPNRF